MQWWSVAAFFKIKDGMSKSLRVLWIDESQDDVEDGLAKLGESYNPVIERVTTLDDLQTSLDRQSWDVVLSDYRLSEFGWADVLAILQRHSVTLPLIIVARPGMGEEAVVAALRAGVRDFVLKMRLARLPQAIAQAVEVSASARLGITPEAARLQRLMVEASEMLSSSLDQEASLTGLARMVVPLLAEVCLVHVLEADQAIRQVVVAAIRPNLQRQFEELWTTFPSTLDHTTGVGRVLLSGQAEFRHQVTSGLSVFNYPDHKITSYIIVPLNARNRTFGTITFLSCSPDRLYETTDLMMAEGLARRAAVLVDNARLYQDAQAALEAEVQVEQQLIGLADVLGRQASELNAIFDAIPDGIFVTDIEGAIIRSNAVGAAMMGTQREQLTKDIARHIRLSLPDGTHLPIEDFPLNTALRGKTGTDFRVRLTRLQGDQAVMQLRFSYAPISDAGGTIMGAVAVASDVTRLYELERQKDEFISIASHELRTPLTTIKGLTQIAHRRLSRAGHETEARMLDKIEHQVNRLIELTNELLDVSRIDAGQWQLQFSQFDLAALTQQVAEALQDTTERHTIQVDAPAALVLVGDRNRLEQVISNLLSNAIKYSPSGGPVEINLTEASQTAELAVRDYGVGIPTEDRETVFGRFYRASNVTEHQLSGFGLGLYISQSIVQGHQGRIWLSDELDEREPGSLFRVSLPLVLGQAQS